MSFPGTPILDTFDRANEGPPPSASWTTVGATGWKVSANRVTANGAGASTVWNTTYGSDVEFYATFVSGNGWAFFIRYNSGTGNGYYFYYSSSVITLYRRTNFVDAIMGTKAVALVANDVIGIGASGSKIQVFLNGTAVITATDATFATVNQFFIYSDDATTTLDSFGGGTSRIIVANVLTINTKVKAPTFTNLSSVTLYNRFKKNLLAGLVDFSGSGSHQIKCALISSSYVLNIDHNILTEISTLFETSGTGYAAGGVALSNFFIGISSGNGYYFTCDPARWNNASFSARYAIIYDNTLLTKDLIMCIDLGKTYTTTNSSLVVRFPKPGLIILK